MKGRREIWLVALSSEGEGPPMSMRMKRCLKWLLRSFGLRNQGCTAAMMDEKEINQRLRHFAEGKISERSDDQ